MRIVLKPAGLVTLLLAFCILLFLAIYNVSRRMAMTKPGTVLLSEDFSSAPVGNSLPDWVYWGSGTWKVAGSSSGTKEYYQGTPTGDPRGTIGAPEWQNYSVSVDMSVDSVPHPGGVALIGRALDNENFYQLEMNTIDGNAVEIVRCVKNKFESLTKTKVDWVAKKWYTLRLTAKDNRLESSLSTDGGKTWKTLGTVTDNTFLQGKVGLKTWQTSAHFAHLRVVQQ